jgi:large subunit ribosomal protein L29
MKLAELQGKTPDQLNETVLSLKKELFNLRFQIVSGEAKNPNAMKTMRRTIARAKTLLRAQALGVSAASAKAEKKTAAKKSSAKKTKKEEV